jgi:tRNA(Arg) A34 adenosine deaminase TadA
MKIYSIYSISSSILILLSVGDAHQHHHHDTTSQTSQTDQELDHNSAVPVNGIPFSTRAYWMRQANAALQQVTDSPCPFAAFGTVIVNHTDTTSLGEVICIGANSNAQHGNPTLHGEIVAISNCSAILTDPVGKYGFSPAEALEAFQDLTLYTNAESCPMCASAIRWAGMKEYVYGTSIETLVGMGWGQIDISSKEVFERSKGLRSNAGVISEMCFLLGDVLSNETDVYFGWQFDGQKECPKGCARVDGMCEMAVDGEGTRQHDEI